MFAIKKKKKKFSDVISNVKTIKFVVFAIIMGKSKTFIYITINAKNRLNSISFAYK